MKRNRDHSAPRAQVLLTGLSGDGDVVIEETLSVVEYYEELHPLLDDDGEFRRGNGIRKVRGKIFNYDGILDQEFANEYGEDGSYLKGRIEFSDGTIVET